MKYILLLTVMTIQLSGALSQSLRNDSICLPVAQLKLALKKIEEGKAVAKTLALLEEENALLEAAMDVKDSIIRLQGAKEVHYQSLLQNTDSVQSNLQTQLRAQQFELTTLNRQLKRQKQKTWLTGLSGIALSVGVTLLFIK